MATTAKARDDTLRVTLSREWAREEFKTWVAKARALDGFWARIRAGRQDDGTAGVAPFIAYGDAGFRSSARGNRPAPTTSLYASCVAVNGRDAVR